MHAVLLNLYKNSCCPFELDCWPMSKKARRDGRSSWKMASACPDLSWGSLSHRFDPSASRLLTFCTLSYTQHIGFKIQRNKIKRLKRMLFIMIKHKMQIFRVSPLFKLQNKQWLNREKLDVGHLWFIYVWLTCFVMLFWCPDIGLTS